MSFLPPTQGLWSGGGAQTEPLRPNAIMRGLNSVTATNPDSYEFIGFGEGGGQNPYTFIL